MKKVFSILTALVLVTAGFTYGQQAKSAKEVFAWWFDHNCEVEQEDKLKMVRQFPEELSTMFIQAFETGPDQAWVNKMAEAEMRMVRANMDFINKGKGEMAGLTKEQIEAYKKMDLQAYEADFRASLAEGYKMTAISGLVETRSDQGRAYLKKMADDKRNPNQQMAQKMLQKMAQ